MSQAFTLYSGQIRIEVDNDGGGIIEAALPRETCPYCGGEDCVYSCDESAGSNDGMPEMEEDVAGRLKYNGFLDCLESVLLGAACAGMITESEDHAWNEIIRTAMDAAGDNY